MSAKETTITRRAIKEINKIPGCYCEKIHGSRFSNPTLDIIGAKEGVMFWIEMKQPGKEPSPRQWATMRKWKEKGGAKVAWADSWENALNFVKKI